MLTIISYKYFRVQWLKNVLTTFGIVLGVAVFFAMRTANSSLRGEFHKTIDKIAGKAVLQVHAGEAGFPENVLDQVLATAGVDAAVPVIEVVAHPDFAAEGNLLVLGVDLIGDTLMREYEIEGQEEGIADPLTFLAQPDSICLTRDFADRHGLDIDDPIVLRTATGKRRFVVRGVVKPKGMATAFGGNLAIMDIYAAQFVFGRGQRFDRIDIALKAQEAIDAVRHRLRQRLSDGLKVETPHQRGTQMEALIESFSAALAYSSMFALFVGVFLIFNSFSVAVTRRRKDIGILRAVGATRRQIRNLFLAEGLILGLIGSMLGVLVGWAGARAVISFMEKVVEDTYNVHVQTAVVEPQASFMIASLALGLGASLLGALIPARAASRVDPVLAIQKGKHQVLMAGENRVRRRFGVALLAAASTLFLVPWGRTVNGQFATFGLMFFGLSLFVPSISHALARLLRPLMRALFKLEGALACDSLIQAPRRTSATVAALMFSLAFVVSAAIFTHSLKTSLIDWMDQSISAEIFVAASENLTSRNFQFPASLGTEIAAIAGVRQVDPVRILNMEYRGGPVMVVSLPIDMFFGRSTIIPVEGSRDEIRGGLLRGEVSISENFVSLHKVHRGDFVELPTPAGLHRFRVAGVARDYSSDRGVVVIDRAHFIRLWGDDRVDTFDLMLTPGSDPDTVKREILKRLGDRQNLFVFTNREFKKKVLALTDQFLALNNVQIVVAISVAILGIINTLFISITDRKRELGILKAVGGLSHQIRKIVVIEALNIALIATLLGIVAGSYLGYFMNQTLSLSITGWRFPYVFPWLTALALFPIMAAVAVLAAWYPARAAVRLQVVEALAYE